MTAGHCICGKFQSKRVPGERPGPDMECRMHPTNKNNVLNQVTSFPGYSNQIYVLAGSKKLSEVTREDKFYMKNAFVKYDENAQIDTYYDIGVLTSPRTPGGKATTFYSSKFDRILKAPICLGAKNDELYSCHITMVGWGSRYGEYKWSKSSSTDNKYSDTYTACSTTGIGPKDHRYKGCELSDLKNNDPPWECKKDFPSSYESEKCKELFQKMNEELEERKMDYDQTNDDDWKKIHDAQKFEFRYPTDDLANSGTICYPEEFFSNDGWCMVEKHKSTDDWGFCDTSCKHVKVCNTIIY